jgi:hypothetical protein
MLFIFIEQEDYILAACRIHQETLNKSIFRTIIPSGAKAQSDFAAFAARLKSCPFKTSIQSKIPRLFTAPDD